MAAPGGKQIINGSALGNNPYMTAGWHIYCVDGGIVQVPSGNPPVLSILRACGGQNGGGFILSSVLAYAQVVYASITGAANWSGYKYAVNANAIMASSGGGPNYYPGSVAGVQQNGGQYY